MKQIAALFLLCALLSAGCAKHEPEKPKISEIFKGQLIQYLKEGGQLASREKGGFTRKELQNSVAQVQATFALVEETWPPSISPEARNSFKKSHQGYMLALKLWQIRIDEEKGYAYPPLPQEFQDYGGDIFELGDYSSSNVQKNLRLIPNDTNLLLLLDLAGTHFKQGRARVIQELER